MRIPSVTNWFTGAICRECDALPNVVENMSIARISASILDLRSVSGKTDMCKPMWMLVWIVFACFCSRHRQTSIIYITVSGY